MANVFDDRSTGTEPNAPASNEQIARQQAINQIQLKRRFWTRAVVSGVVMVVLVIIWATSEYHNAGGLPTSGFSHTSSIHHVWNYWILYPLVMWLALLGVWGYRIYGLKPISENEIKREMGRQTGPSN